MTFIFSLNNYKSTYSFKTGSALIRVGQTEQALGEIEREYIRHAHDGICGPLSRFLEGEMRNITRERKVRDVNVMDQTPIQHVQLDQLLFYAQYLFNWGFSSSLSHSLANVVF